MARRFLLLAILWLAGSGAVLADYDHCASLHAKMPGRLGNLERVDGGAYPERELGFFDRYSGSDAPVVVSVFMYDYGNASINRDVVRTEFEGALQDMRRVAESNGLEGWAVTSELTVNDSRVFTDAVLAASSKDGELRQDVLLLGQSGQCFVKLRLTAVGDETRALGLLSEAAGGVEQALDP